MERFLLAASKLLTKEGVEKGLSFAPRPTDVIICTPAKSGTTWMQQICHGLRSYGDMNFEEICAVIPTIEMAHDYGYTDLQAEQPFQPRMYKTHLPYNFCPKGAGKYIVVVRRPSDTALSFYRFVENWAFSENEISIDEFVEEFYLKIGPLGPNPEMGSLVEIATWYPHRNDENVLWLHYEDMKEDLPYCINLVSGFLGIGVGNEELLKKVAHQASFDFMKKHIAQFDEHLLKLHRNEAIGQDKMAGMGINSGKVRKGLDNESKSVLSKKALDSIQQKWTAVMTPISGYKTYDDMRKGVNKELERRFRSSRSLICCTPWI